MLGRNLTSILLQPNISITALEFSKFEKQINNIHHFKIKY